LGKARGGRKIAYFPGKWELSLIFIGVSNCFCHENYAFCKVNCHFYVEVQSKVGKNI
jgi:hypothetical protein